MAVPAPGPESESSGQEVCADMMIESGFSEKELVLRFKQGDESAFKALVDRHKKKAFSFIYRITRNSEDSADLLQEAFIRAYQGLPRFREDAKFSTWFYRILVNLSRDWIRRRVRGRKLFCDFQPRREDEETDAPDIPDTSLCPRRQAMNKELGELVEDAAGGLPSMQRMAFTMKYLEGMETEEISRILGCRPSTVKVHLFRSLAALRVKLAPYLKR